MSTEVGDGDGGRAAGSAELLPAYGYYRVHVFMEAREKAEIRRALERYALANGYRLGKVFEERPETSPAAFAALRDAAAADQAVVIVPSLVHFSVHGNAVTIRSLLAGATGRPVLEMEPLPPDPEPFAVMGRLVHPHRLTR